MSVKLLTEHHLEFFSLKEAAQAPLSPHMSKYYIVGNHVSRLNYVLVDSDSHCQLSPHLRVYLIGHRSQICNV